LNEFAVAGVSSFITGVNEFQEVGQDSDLSFAYVGYSAEYPKSKLTVELDTAHATWVAHDVALISSKSGMLLYLSLVYEGRSGSCFHLYFLSVF
jgi:hypothetical protein